MGNSIINIRFLWFHLQVSKTWKPKISFLNSNEIKIIEFDGYKYWYIQRPATNKEICLATENINEYCNGLYSFSSKDSGNGIAYVVIGTNNPKYSLRYGKN